MLLKNDAPETAIAPIVGHEGKLVTSQVYWNVRDPVKRKPIVDRFQPHPDVCRTAAEDLQLSMDKDFFQFGKPSARNLRTMEAFSQPIKSLPPGGKLVFALAQGFIIFAKGADQSVVPSQFKVKALCRSGSKTIEEVNHIDLTPYIGSEGERDPIVDELEKMRAILDKRK